MIKYAFVDVSHYIKLLCHKQYNFLSRMSFLILIYWYFLSNLISEDLIRCFCYYFQTDGRAIEVMHVYI